MDFVFMLELIVRGAWPIFYEFRNIQIVASSHLITILTHFEFLRKFDVYGRKLII